MRACLIGPVFPVTMFVACLGVWCGGQELGQRPNSIAGCSWRQKVVASSLVVLAGCGFLGFHQDWSRVYPPLANDVVTAEYRQAGSKEAFLMLGPVEGRRSAWLARRLFEEPRVAATSLRSSATLLGVAGWVELWQMRQVRAPGFRLGQSHAVLKNREMISGQ